MQNAQIQEVKSHKHLGIYLSNDCSWHQHINSIKEKAWLRSNMDRVKRIWYLSPMRAAKVQASLRIRAVSPEPSLLAHTSSESRGTFREKARSLAPLNGWACAVKICHDGMLEDTNSLDGAHIMRKLKFKFDRKSFETIYIAFMRPLLEYGDSIQDQDSLLVKRRNDNHSPGPVIRELVPSSHHRSELSDTILCIFSKWDQRIGEGIPIPDSLGEEATFINICISNGRLKCHRVLISTTPSFGDKVICWYTGFTFKTFI